MMPDVKFIEEMIASFAEKSDDFSFHIRIFNGK